MQHTVRQFDHRNGHVRLATSLCLLTSVDQNKRFVTAET